MPPLSERFRKLPPYMLAGIPQKKRDLLARGVDVIDLGAGDADLPAPPGAVEALVKAARTPAMGRYGFGLGLPAFREAASAFMQKRFGQRFDSQREIVPLIGSKEGLTHLALAYLQRGDVAVVPEPGYAAYGGGSALSEATAYVYPLRPRTGFLVELEEIPDEALRQVRLVYLNYPNNPTAAIAPRDYLERTVRLCRERDILLVYDNAYAEMGYDGYVPPSIFEVDGAREVAVEFHSLSKTYNMTGWRCGWMAGRADVCAALATVKSFTDTGQFMAVQAAGVAALESYDQFVPGNLAVFKARRDATVAAFRAAGFRCETPRATMYCWIALPDGLPSALFAERLMEDEGVIVLPGSAFGAGGEGFFRVSFIVPEARAQEAAGRAGRVLAGLERAALGHRLSAIG
ncbi:MAG TPA: aminotransferase class I/II-fold pyridoxal phosphate-dependent enzyme [Gemmatimonadaceae bacterium]|nr:aminotransferase class I/II-fold pyridoxal phosphate-dependent enzyme [Gemmatimonadaceae bacterium]